MMEKSVDTCLFQNFQTEDLINDFLFRDDEDCKKKELADIEAALQIKRDKESAAAKRKLGQTNGFRKIKKPNIGEDDDDSDY